MALAPGTRIGGYEIRSQLGAGGMGEVYRARDPELGRDVALKLLPETFAQDADSRRRFEREAQAVAALTHPNIVAIYELGREGERLFAATELLEGETLRARLRQGPLSLRKVRDYGCQIALGLAAAHDKGVVHRDLKPENVFVCEDGLIKILDFGLARHDPPVAAGTDTNMPTPAPPTSPGAVLGTVGYMSPEQARGEEADARSDIFSLGVVLYEMLTGKRAFGKGSGADLLGAILRDDPPPPSEIDPKIPSSLDLLVHHCLEKSPDERFQSARDLAFHLGSVTGSVSVRAAPPPLPDRTADLRRRRLAAGAVALVALAAAFETGRRLSDGADARTVASDAGPRAVSFRQLTDLPGEEREAQLGPGGKAFVFVSDAAGSPDVYLQRLGGRNPINLTEDSPVADTSPAFSPDGERIAFRSERDGGGLFVMGSTGESVRRLTDRGQHPAWWPDGSRIVFATERGDNPWSRGGASELWSVTLEGGEPERLEVEGDATQPRVSPDGRHIAYWGIRGESGQRDIFTVGAGGGAPVAVTNDLAIDWSPAWSPDGRFLYFASERGGSMNVWRVPIDPGNGAALGEAVPVTTPSRSAGALSLGAAGDQLAFVSWDRRSTVLRAELDADAGRIAGPPTPVLRGTRVIFTHDLSPDGEWIAFTTLGTQEDLFVVRADGSGYRQLTDDAHRDRGPRWSPDGRRIAFYTDRSGRYETWSIRPDGSDLEQLSRTKGPPQFLPVWSPDGGRIATFDESRTWVWDLAPALEAREPVALPDLGPPTPLIPRSWSPDGARLAGDLAFNDAGEDRTFVYSFETGEYREIAAARGAPAWLSDSRRLLVMRDDAVLLVDTATGASQPLLDVGATEVGLSSDDRWFTWVETTVESDVWLAELQ